MLKLAFVGLGWWGKELARAASELPSRMDIAGCYSLSPSEITDFKALYSAKPYASYNEVLNDASINGVVLSTPHTCHASQVAQAAKARKQIFVEKPLALSLKEAFAAAQICADQKVVLAVGHNRRFSPVAQELKTWIDKGRFGQVLHVEAHFSGNSAMNFTKETWRANRRESPAGSLVSIGLHMIDTVQWLKGPIERLACLSKRQVLQVDIDDTTTALFELERGVTGTIGTLFATPQNSYLRIYGTHGIAEAKNDFSELVWLGDQQQPEEIGLDPVNTLVAELTAFCDACDDIKPYPVSPREASQNVAVIEAMSTSGNQNGKWVNVTKAAI